MHAATPSQLSPLLMLIRRGIDNTSTQAPKKKIARRAIMLRCLDDGRDTDDDGDDDDEDGGRMTVIFVPPCTRAGQRRREEKLGLVS